MRTRPLGEMVAKSSGTGCFSATAGDGCDESKLTESSTCSDMAGAAAYLSAALRL